MERWGYRFYVELCDVKNNCGRQCIIASKYWDEYLSLISHKVKHFGVIMLGCRFRKIFTILEITVLEKCSFLHLLAVVEQSPYDTDFVCVEEGGLGEKQKFSTMLKSVMT